MASALPATAQAFAETSAETSGFTAGFDPEDKINFEMFFGYHYI